jgi:hypothetical protein
MYMAYEHLKTFNFFFLHFLYGPRAPTFTVPFIEQWPMTFLDSHFRIHLKIVNSYQRHRLNEELSGSNVPH